MQIKFSARGIEEVKKFLQGLPYGAKVVVMRAFSEHIIGDENHGLKHEPQQVEHGEGNPYQWQSEKQRKAFFASDGFGQGIPTKRTHEGVNSWTMKVVDSNWTQVKIEGGNIFVQGNFQQRGHKADGWKTYFELLASNTAGGLRHAHAKLNEWLRGKGK